jgi:hypothetical protein
MSDGPALSRCDDSSDPESWRLFPGQGLPLMSLIFQSFSITADALSNLHPPSLLLAER